MREGSRDDSALLARLRAGDPRAFEELVTTYQHRIFGVALIFSSLYLVYLGALQAVGATKRTLRITLIAVVCVQTPLAAVLSFGTDLGVWGVWISVPIAAMVKFVLGWFAYRGNPSFVVSAVKSG